MRGPGIPWWENHEMPTETVLLKNGSDEAKPLVATTLFVLEGLAKELPIVLYELAELCKDPAHKPFGRCGDDLVDRNLATRDEDGTYRVHNSIRNIVLSAVEGEEMDMTLGNPVATRSD
jgi:hypothetical protein